MTTTTEIMEQAQVFASAWSLVGGQFDDGTMHDTALEEKAILRSAIEALVRDAARYAWLRENHQAELGSGGKFDLQKYGTLNWVWVKYEWSGGKPHLVLELDQAIDAVLAAQKEKAK